LPQTTINKAINDLLTKMLAENITNTY